MKFFVYLPHNYPIWKFQEYLRIKFFVLIYLFNQYFQAYIYKTERIFLYPEKKLKIKDVCALSGQTIRELGSDKIYTDYLYLKNHCDKTEKCYKTEEGIFQCGEKILLQKIGDDCAINEECFTGLCSFGRCFSIGNDDDCTVDNVPDNPEKVCNPGHWCYEYDVLNHLYKCIPYIGEGEYYDELNGKKCRLGLKPFVDSNTYFEKCTKIGSVEIGENSPDPEMCKSGFSIGYENDEIVIGDSSKIKCFSINTDSKCEQNIDEEGNIKYLCKPIVEGLDVYTVELEIECDNINDVYVCPYSKGKEKSFKEYISALNSIDINEVYADEHKYHLIGYGDNDLSKAYLKYRDYNYLYAMGIIDDDGNIRKSKEDEWEFYWRFNNSNDNNISILLLLLLYFL